jgi:adhesin transport system membrane fusion protein
MTSSRRATLSRLIDILRAPRRSLMDARQIGDGAGAGIAYAARIPQARQSSSMLLYTIFIVFASMGVWAAVAKVDDIARADGRVIPSARLQIVQNLEGGIVQALHVRQGESVEAGALILSLSATQFGAERDARRQQLYAIQSKTARLRAEVDGHEPEFDEETRVEGAEFIAQELAEFNSRRSRQFAELSVIASQLQQRLKEAEDTRKVMQTAQNSLASARQELSIVSRMVERGLEPRLELVRLQGRIADLEGRFESARIAIPRLEAAIEEVQAKREQALRQFKTEAASELGKTTLDLRNLQTSLPALSDKVERADIRAPVKGVINRLLVTTIGGVVKPGEPIAEIVPAEDQLVIEVRIRPQDIGFVRTGMPARVKLTAYDYSIFGSMEGTVTQLGADAVPSEDRSQPNAFFFVARVETKAIGFESFGRQLPVIPGMQAQVDIVTGEKTVLSYLSKPLIGVKENAFRER